jgi:hypothetical protein
MRAVIYLFWNKDTRRVEYSESWPEDGFLEQYILTWLEESERKPLIEARCDELQLLADNTGKLLRRIVDIEERIQKLEER